MQQRITSRVIGSLVESQFLSETKNIADRFEQKIGFFH